MRRRLIVANNLGVYADKVARLLVWADSPTLDPTVIRRIRLKKERGENLSKRELGLLEKADALDEKLKEGPADASEATPEEEPIWSHFISKEQWDSIPEDKKPLMEEYFQKAYENATAGKERHKELGLSDFAEGEVVEEGDHLSEVRRYAKNISLKTKNLRRLTQNHLQEFSKDPDLSQSLTPLVQQALEPLDSLDLLLKRIEFSLGEITPQTAGSKLPLAEKAVRKAISLFREWGSDLGSVFHEDRQKSMTAAEGLKKVLSERFKVALKELRAKGMTPEQAAEQAGSIPSIQKMNAALMRANSRVQAYDLVLNEMASVYDNSRPMLKSMESALEKLMSSYGKKVANLQEELVLTSSSPNKKVAKQLVLLSQRIKLVRNIAQKLLDKARSGTQAEQQASKEIEGIIEAVTQPLDQAEAMVRGAEKTVLSLNKENYKKMLGNVEVAIDTISDSVEAFSSNYARDLQALLDKHNRIIKGLTSTFSSRFTEGRDQLMARGLSKEEATAKLNAAPSMKQMVRTLTLAKIKADVYQELLFGLDGVAGSLMEQNIPKLKEEFSSLKSYLGEGKGGEKAASSENLKKRLNKVSKRVLLLAYLRRKSL